MPAIHSSPHPINDLNVDWNPKEDSMENPYPPNVGGVQPGYDYDQWTGGENLAGRGRHPMTMPFPMQNNGPVWTHASHFDTGNGRRLSNHHHSHQHTNRNPRPSSRARFGPTFDEEELEEDEGWSDEGNFEYDSYDEDEPGFLPPNMGRGRGHGRAWDSSDGDEFEDEDEEAFSEDEDEDVSYAAEVHANMRQHGGRPMPRRGQPHRHQGGMRRSGPPPLETPPDSPPPLARGMPFPRGMGQPMMRGRGIMRGRGMGPHTMNRGGVRMMPVRGGPPRGQGMPMHQGRAPMRRARFADSPSSSSGDGGFHHGAARVRRGSTGGSFKKAIRWLKPNSTPIKLNHFLRTGTLLNPVARTSWDVSRPPVTVRAGVPVGFEMTNFSEPATSPPVVFMRLLVPIPGLRGDQWVVDVWPLRSPYATVNQIPPSPYSFTGSPGVPMSPFPGQRSRFGPPTPIVRCTDVLHTLYTMLQRRATADEFYSLDDRRKERVSRAFWLRCQMLAAEAVANMGAPPPIEQEEMNRQVNLGIKRIDFMAGKTRWEGLEPGDEDDEWIVRLGHA